MPEILSLSAGKIGSLPEQYQITKIVHDPYY